jgi:hypothetical protein
MTSKKHQHRAATSIDRCFAGPVAERENPAAHGNIVQIDTCRCGAERRTNINQQHIERGAWSEA